jgi:hypothetical protein
MDGWHTRSDILTHDTGLGIHTAEIPTAGFVPGRAIVFTWKNLASGEWLGQDHTVTVNSG